MLNIYFMILPIGILSYCIYNYTLAVQEHIQENKEMLRLIRAIYDRS